jgi:hypothetical protein
MQQSKAKNNFWDNLWATLLGQKQCACSVLLILLEAFFAGIITGLPLKAFGSLKLALGLI